MEASHSLKIEESLEHIAVSSCMPISYGYTFAEDIFSTKSSAVSQHYNGRDRCLMIIDYNVHRLLGAKTASYFVAHGIRATICPVVVTEDRKDVAKLLEVCQLFVDFDLLRREPVLVVGGGLLTDIVG